MATMKSTTYAGIDRLIGSADSVVIGHNTRAYRDGTDIVIRLWATDIVRLHDDRNVSVRDGDYTTVTTYDRLKQFAPNGWKVYRRNGDGWAESIRGARMVVHGDRWLRLEDGGYGYPD